MNGRGVSIQDVAAEARVSIATVSRVLNNPEVVAPETTAKVNAVVRRLGYVPNPFAQGLITRASRVLGFALPDIHGEYYSELLKGADAEAHRRGYYLLVSSEAPFSNNGHRRRLAFGLVDALALMITEPNDTLWKEARGLDLPVVVMDIEVHEPGVDSVLIDNAIGAREATKHLLQGTPADKLYFLGGPRENFDSRKRAEVFAGMIRAEGTEVREDQIAFGTYSTDFGVAWAKERLQKGLRWAGVLAGNDEIALGVLQTALEQGVKVPEELRIVGFDDTRLASLVRPRLSSVHVPMAEVGAAAITALVERIAEPGRPSRTVSLATKLVVRESSRV